MANLGSKIFETNIEVQSELLEDSDCTSVGFKIF